MRIAIAVAMVLALAACSRPGGQFLAGDGRSVTTTTEGSADAASVAEDTTTEPEAAAATTTVAAQAATVTTVVTPGVVTPTTLAPAPQATTTTTTVAALTVDPQEVESALAELDELLSSLGSAMSAMEQAFEQGE